ncbi:MAG: M20/M25/M40 family metallo-hydrolase [Fimbriiglobus sp.]
MAVDVKAAVARLMGFLEVPGITGEEAKIAKAVQVSLKEAGVPAKAIRFDDVNTRIPVPTQTGNLIVNLPGHGSKKTADPLLFMTHLDTVPICAGAKPKITGKKIVNTVNTGLGGDNRTGCAVIVSLVAELIRQKPDHPPITLLFTVREESGLFGAQHLNPADLGPGSHKLGFNFDGRASQDIIIGAVGADRWEVEIHGKASHAGVAPQKGISSTLILALAIADVRARGFFGEVIQGDKRGTSNVGEVSGGPGKPAGDATNVVTDYVFVRGESRSHDAKFVREITAAYKEAFAKAVALVPDDEGKVGKVKFTSRSDYTPFRMKDNAAVVLKASEAVKALGMVPNLRVTNGGLDANWMNKHGIPTVTLGAGQNAIHTVNEWVDLTEFEHAVNLAYLIATQ